MPALLNFGDLPGEAQEHLLEAANAIAAHTIPHDLRKIGEEGENFIIYGPASVEVVDKEGDLIPAEALKEGLPQLLRRARISVGHEDTLVGEILPTYTSKNGVVYKTEVVNGRLMLVANIWNDTHDSRETRRRINQGLLRSFSISGKALEARPRVDDEGRIFNEIRRLDLSAVTVCEEGINPEARFKVIAKQRIQKPFADYKDFDACVQANRGKVSNPEAYCAAIHHRATGKWPSEKMKSYWTIQEEKKEKEVEMTEEEKKAAAEAEKQKQEPPEEETGEATGDAIQELAEKINSLAEDLDKLKLAVYSKAEEEGDGDEEDEEDEGEKAQKQADDQKPAGELAKQLTDLFKQVEELRKSRGVQKAETPRPAAENQAPVLGQDGFSMEAIRKAVAGNRVGDLTGLPDVAVPAHTKF